MEADFVIVGGGSAGCVLANRLSADGKHTVIMIEAGPPDKSAFIHMPAGIIPVIRSDTYNWKYWTAPEPEMGNRPMFWPRGRTLGGRSTSSSGLVEQVASFSGLVTPAVTVTGILPTSGSTLGGTGVTITGTGFTGATAVTIGKTGMVQVTVAGEAAPQTVGQIELANFMNEGGLEAIGDNLLMESGASGSPNIAAPGQPGFGTLLQNYTESSNVDSVSEITALIVAQRAYEMNSKVITTADQMLQATSQLRS